MPGIYLLHLDSHFQSLPIWAHKNLHFSPISVSLITFPNLISHPYFFFSPIIIMLTEYWVRLLFNFDWILFVFCLLSEEYLHFLLYFLFIWMIGGVFTFCFQTPKKNLTFVSLTLPLHSLVFEMHFFTLCAFSSSNPICYF